MPKFVSQLGIFVCVMFCATGFSCYGQTQTTKDTLIKVITIRGTVRDLSPMPKIVVVEKGTNNTAITDSHGNFTLEIPIGHFAKEVRLRFEKLGSDSVETKISATTEHLDVQFNRSKAISTKWTFKAMSFRPSVSRVIEKTVEAIIRSQIKSPILLDQNGN